ncbi:TetR family transcriptional regulator [Paenibacillus donghaensis]|uniref:TetR/AcrR family transcriptional regulator C-terminal domain-containing protein n=1 Tax=Paenibacillus donghaensis TaxID=414771 RepID=UPI001884685B|nr:TetR/AcrR family transcriptional regulator C-terminal domain-containing protein [Paenibacillus donghaensis]MBE9914095.1 TetR family transcriptional regulator [Paenibacillus donghaensis]
MTRNSNIRTKRDITNAFIELLTTKTFSSITIHDICEKSLVHRSTFYRYYEDKYDLLNHVTIILGNNLFQNVNSNHESSHSFYEQILDYVEEHKQLFLNITIKNNNSDAYNELVKMGSRFLMENSKAMDDPISQKIRQSNYSKLACDFYMSGFVEVLKNWIGGNYKIPKHELTESLQKLME